MTEELKIAIEDLYATFSVYPLRSTMEGCPCCVSDSDKEKIHSKTLRELDEDDLSRYTTKAMTTWGDENDYRHYLPRIFELLSTTGFIVDTFIVLGKLEYGNWKTWAEKEQVAIRQFLLAWWSDLISTKTYFDKEAFIEICKLTGNMDEIVKRWILTKYDNSFLNYVDLVYNYYNDLSADRNDFKELKKTETDKLLNWINVNANLLEQGFFNYADKDKEIAEKISLTQYIFERT